MLYRDTRYVVAYGQSEHEFTDLRTARRFARHMVDFGGVESARVIDVRGCEWVSEGTAIACYVCRPDGPNYWASV